MTGEEVDFRGRFFNLHGAIRPAPAPAIPILVGGRSDAALARAGRLGDGWLALWVSPRRFTDATGRIEAAAGEGGRAASPGSTRFSSGPASTPVAREARERVSTAMEAAYALPFDRFERYTPCGPPAAVAEALTPYLAVGCRCFNFVPEATSLPAAIEAASEVKALLSEPRSAPAALRP